MPGRIRTPLTLKLTVTLVVLAGLADRGARAAESNERPQTATGASETSSQFVRLSRDDEVWVDAKNKRVIVGGQVCLTRGFLEMFACPKGTKEHESIVSLNAKAYQIHAALLAIGAKPGRTVQYSPEYIPADGSRIEVLVQWKGEDGKVRVVRAQEWIRHVKTSKEMSHDWVFAGSGFWHDEQTGKRYYYAEGGEVICVSNFGTAMLDLPIQSSQDNAQLMFEVFTERVPPRETPVKLILFVKPSDEERQQGRPAERGADGAKADPQSASPESVPLVPDDLGQDDRNESPSSSGPAPSSSGPSQGPRE